MVLYYSAPKGNGPFNVLICNKTMKCEYCIDKNNDNICSDTECLLISCKNSKDCVYCLDCNRDGVCDPHIKMLKNCIKGELCTTIDYCEDENLNMVCDTEEKSEIQDETVSLIDEWSLVNWQ